MTKQNDGKDPVRCLSIESIEFSPSQYCSSAIVAWCGDDDDDDDADTSEILGELDQLRDLKADWDSYGAPPPNAAAIDTAKAFYQQLVAEANKQEAEFLSPAVQTSGAGTVGFAWNDQQGKTLEVEAHPDGVLTYVSSDGEDVSVGEVDSAAAILDKIRS